MFLLRFLINSLHCILLWRSTLIVIRKNRKILTGFPPPWHSHHVQKFSNEYRKIESESKVIATASYNKGNTIRSRWEPTKQAKYEWPNLTKKQSSTDRISVKTKPKDLSKLIQSYLAFCAWANSFLANSKSFKTAASGLLPSGASDLLIFLFFTSLGWFNLKKKRSYQFQLMDRDRKSVG